MELFIPTWQNKIQTKTSSVVCRSYWKKFQRFKVIYLSVKNYRFWVNCKITTFSVQDILQKFNFLQFSENIGPIYPLVNAECDWIGTVLSKNQGSLLQHSRWGRIETPPCLKATTHWAILCSPLPTVITYMYPYEWNIFQWDIQQYTIIQSICRCTLTVH